MDIYLKCFKFVQNRFHMKVAELDITTLDVSELKELLLKQIRKAKSKAQLLRIIERVEEVFDEDAEDAAIFWSRYTPEQRIELEKSFEETLDKDNWISHDDMKKKHAKWLKSN